MYKVFQSAFVCVGHVFSQFDFLLIGTFDRFKSTPPRKLHSNIKTPIQSLSTHVS